MNSAQARRRGPGTPPRPAALTLSAADPDWPRRAVAALRRSPARAGGVRVLAVEGRSGAGKTTLARRLAAEAGCPLLHMDDLYPGWSGLAAAVPLVRQWVLEPLARGADPRWRPYDWARGAFGDWQTTPVRGELVVEGCGSGAAELRPHLAALAWVEAPREERERRLDARWDAAEYAPYRHMWADQEDAFYAAHHPREHADLVIDNGGPAPAGGAGRGAAD
ncbi:hypothetical protein HNR12_000136 [Streptomonospora nanhaiensis]|uniref:Uridine kinase n=1 Tax=Streptomonospora nanhaiensis TaxID=1323731 RepID=A0A853BF13_9ACTN|nr:hypothetical protein [Streptomonospora nanhaiensis]NYI93859.1 hypothetical protein [Streptomonospora nanhaiensis]